MSRVIVSCGNASNSVQLHVALFPPAPMSEKLQRSSGVCGVGPAESTGKSRVSYCPGGSFAARPASGRRPRKPREMGELIACLQVRCAAGTASRDCARSLCALPRRPRSDLTAGAHEPLDERRGFVDRGAPRVDLDVVEERIEHVAMEVALHV